MIIDHIYLPVSDLKRSSEFYKKMLEPLGIDMPYEFDQLLGFAINTEPGFWLKNGEVAKDLYVAFTAKSTDAVRASYKAAIDAAATSIKEPSLRPEWRADYFAANIGDPDGYNIEIAYKPWLYKKKVRAIYPSEASRHKPALGVTDPASQTALRCALTKRRELFDVALPRGKSTVMPASCPNVPAASRGRRRSVSDRLSFRRT